MRDYTNKKQYEYRIDPNDRCVVQFREVAPADAYRGFPWRTYLERYSSDDAAHVLYLLHCDETDSVQP